jgi:hypothetical protein
MNVFSAFFRLIICMKSLSRKKQSRNVFFYFLFMDSLCGKSQRIWLESVT